MQCTSVLDVRPHADRGRRTVLGHPSVAALRGQVLGYRAFEAGPCPPRRRLLMPDGVVRLMLGFGSPVRVEDAACPDRAVTGASLLTAARATALVAEHSGRVRCVTVLLTPQAAYRAFGTPMIDWSELVVHPARLLGGSVVSGLVERLEECPDWASRFALLDQELAARMLIGPPISPEVDWAHGELRRAHGRVRVSSLAAAVGWSSRQLERRFRQQIGPSPKGVAQILRLQRVLGLQEGGLPWTEAALAAGFADQPHFDRTFKRMAGCTPSHFSSARTRSAPEERLDHLAGHLSSVLLPVRGASTPPGPRRIADPTARPGPRSTGMADHDAALAPRSTPTSPPSPPAAPPWPAPTWPARSRPPHRETRPAPSEPSWSPLAPRAVSVPAWPRSGR
jgi:AraC-like DNA-binding protein